MSEAATRPLAGADGSFPAARYAQFVVAVLTLVYTASFLDRQIISLMGERVRADLALSDVQLGLLQGLSFALFYTALGIPMGMLADRTNRRRLILGGLILWSLATALCGLVSSFPSLFAARMLVGVGEAALAPAAYSLISDYFPDPPTGACDVRLRVRGADWIGARLHGRRRHPSRRRARSAGVDRARYPPLRLAGCVHRGKSPRNLPALLSLGGP